MTRFTRLGVVLALGWLFFTSPARAVFHLMMVVEVFPGYASAPNAQYVELQMYFPGQNLVGGHVVQVFDSAGTLIMNGTFTFPTDVPNGADQASILIATAEAQALFGITADLTMTPLLNPAGGKVCFDVTPIDCVAWGNYTGSAAGVGSPFSPGGLPLGQSAQRQLGANGVLDSGDDTNNSVADFVSAAPTPRNNSNALGTPPLDFFTVTPCRVVDTRSGAPVAAGFDRTFVMVGGTCAVPATAKAVSLNVAVTDATAGGNVRLFPTGAAVPVISTINYSAGQTRTNNVVVSLSALGELTARCAPIGSTHLILDVNGYFE
jgi:hypothetical protein